MGTKDFMEASDTGLDVRVAQWQREAGNASSVASGSYGLDDECRDLVRAELVRVALVQLSESERSVIELAYFGGYTYHEVARILGEPETTIKRRMRCGLRRLRRNLHSGR